MNMLDKDTGAGSRTGLTDERGAEQRAEQRVEQLWTELLGLL